MTEPEKTILEVSADEVFRDDQMYVDGRWERVLCTHEIGGGRSATLAHIWREHRHDRERTTCTDVFPGNYRVVVKRAVQHTVSREKRTTETKEN